MKEKELYILLTVIKNNGDVKRLIREGLSYKDVAEMTNKAISDGLIVYDNDLISLSEKGRETYLMLDKKLKIIDKSKWIEPENKSRTSILDKNDVFLPNQNDLSFN